MKVESNSKVVLGTKIKSYSSTSAKVKSLICDSLLS